jgi:ATP synthase protein I
MPFHRPLPESDSQSKISSGVSAVVTFEKGMQLALTLPSAVVVGWLIGAWADRHFHQEWISIAGIAFGAVSGLFYVIKTVLHNERSSRNETRPKPETGESAK